MIFIASLVLLLIIKLRFPKGKSIHRVIQERYGRPLLTLFRRCELFDLKIRKTECDIEFLKVCQENNLTPKFVNFKLYKKNIRSTCHFRQFQNKLINNELSEKEKNLKKLRSENKNLVNKLRNSISYLDANHLFTFINNINDKKITKVKNVHYKKLFNLGLQHEVTRLNPKDLIFNYSNRIYFALMFYLTIKISKLAHKSDLFSSIDTHSLKKVRKSNLEALGIGNWLG